MMCAKEYADTFSRRRPHRQAPNAGAGSTLKELPAEYTGYVQFDDARAIRLDDVPLLLLTVAFLLF